MMERNKNAGFLFNISTTILNVCIYIDGHGYMNSAVDAYLQHILYRVGDVSYALHIS